MFVRMGMKRNRFRRSSRSLRSDSIKTSSNVRLERTRASSNKRFSEIFLVRVVLEKLEKTIHSFFRLRFATNILEYGLEQRIKRSRGGLLVREFFSVLRGCLCDRGMCYSLLLRSAYGYLGCIPNSAYIRIG